MGIFGKFFNKNKVDYKIKAEHEQSLVYMLMPKKAVKLKSKIMVPENFCVVILSKEKLLDQIPAGEHELNGFTIEKTCKINKLDKPTKKGYKKTVKLDFYFVNQNICKLQNEFFIKKLKLNVNFVLDFKITNPHKFLKFLIGEKIVFDQKFAQNFLNFKTSQIMYYYFLDNKVLDKEKLIFYITKKLNSVGLEVLNLFIDFKKLEIENKTEEDKQNLTESLKENEQKQECKTENWLENNKPEQQYLFDKQNEKETNFAINYNEIESETNTIKNTSLLEENTNYSADYYKNSEKTAQNTQNLHKNANNYNNLQNNYKQNCEQNFKMFERYDFESDINPNYNNEIKNVENSVNKIGTKFETYKTSSLINLDDIKGESVKYFVCDQCGAKLASNSQVCYNCKKSFVEKNCCENCGREIPENLYVCPYCKCVLIK